MPDTAEKSEKEARAELDKEVAAARKEAEERAKADEEAYLATAKIRAEQTEGDHDDVAVIAAAIAEGERGEPILPGDPRAAGFTTTAKIVLATIKAAKVKA